MARIENTVFISYRRTDVFTALAVYENLKNQGYDVFFDYRSISSGDFEQIIASNIQARAHFIVILTPTALDRCNQPGDWLRREIEFAIDKKRNIIPLLFRGFQFGDQSVTQKLTGKLLGLSRYNGLNVHEDYFDEAMHRLHTQYLNIELETTLRPVSSAVQKLVEEEQVAADQALEEIEDIQELVKIEPEQDKITSLHDQAVQYERSGDFQNALLTYYQIKKLDLLFPQIDTKIIELEKALTAKKADPKNGNFQTNQNRPPKKRPILPYVLGVGLIALLVIFVCTLGTASLWNGLGGFIVVETSTYPASNTLTPTKTRTPTSVPPTFTPTPAVELMGEFSTIEIKEPRSVEKKFVDDHQLNNFSLEVDVTIHETAPEYYGILFRGRNSLTDTFYSFRITPDGLYIFEIWGEEHNDLAGPLSSSFIKRGKDVTNHLMVVAIGNNFDLYINGHKVQSLTDDTYTSGTTGVVACTCNGSPHAFATFSNLEITILP